MKILFFGRYDPDYARNRVLIKGLRMRGVEILECRTSATGWTWPFRLAFSYLKRRPKFDVMFVAFSGQEVVLLARILTRKPIIFDAFTSRYEEYVLDRKKVASGSLKSRWYRWLDQIACRWVDIILTDTNAHKSFFVNEYQLAPEKFHPLFVGTDTDAFYPIPQELSQESFTVHFHGNYIPLQGVRFILKAARLLQHERVIFNLIGRGQTYTADHQYADDLPNVRFLDRVPYAELSSRMNSAHVCLGIFGVSPKTRTVIPNKVYEALAMAKPLITADTPAIRELLDERSAILIPAGDARALADAIRMLRDRPDVRMAIGRAGHEVVTLRATPGLLGKQLLDIMRTLKP